MSLTHLIYMSRAVGDPSTEELAQILYKSVKNNTHNGVTGLLLYANRRFFQVLEGEAGAVHGTFEQIRRDSRHMDVQVVAQGAIVQRRFPHWHMHLQTLDDLFETETQAYQPADVVALFERYGEMGAPR